MGNNFHFSQGKYYFENRKFWCPKNFLDLEINFQNPRVLSFLKLFQCSQKIWNANTALIPKIVFIFRKVLFGSQNLDPKWLPIPPPPLIIFGISVLFLWWTNFKKLFDFFRKVVCIGPYSKLTILVWQDLTKKIISLYTEAKLDPVLRGWF